MCYSTFPCIYVYKFRKPKYHLHSPYFSPYLIIPQGLLILIIVQNLFYFHLYRHPDLGYYHFPLGLLKHPSNSLLFPSHSLWLAICSPYSN